MELKVGVSNRHLHLCREDLDILFGKDYELTKRNDLVQIGEYASNETVILKNKNNILEHVRIIGPLRKKTQVEILKKDCLTLDLYPPYRNSGDLDNSETITIIGPKGEITKENTCIIPNTHIHLNSSNNHGFDEDEIVKVKTKDNKIINNVHIKIREDFAEEFQINKDDALELGLETGDIVTLEKGE